MKLQQLVLYFVCVWLVVAGDLHPSLKGEAKTSMAFFWNTTNMQNVSFRMAHLQQNPQLGPPAGFLKCVLHYLGFFETAIFANV